MGSDTRTGSIPVAGTAKGIHQLIYVRLAQLDRAFGYGPKGRGFESSNARAHESSYSFYTRRIGHVQFFFFYAHGHGKEICS